jgi:arylsulfatase A-like enzyme
VFQPGFDFYTYPGRSERGVERTTAEARRWLLDHARWPFFVFFHTYQVHEPYQSRPRFRRMFARAKTSGRTIPSDDYDAAVRYTDAVLASLFTTLEEAGVADRTIVIVTSDHGEAFAEHGAYGHGNAMYEQVLRVPFIWRAPGLVAAGRRVPGLVGLVDVAPTVLDLLGLPIPPVVQGTSLAAFLRSQPDAPSSAAGRVLFAENSRRGPYTLVARSETWKAFFDPDGKTRVYSLATDPGERNPESGAGSAPAAAAARARFLEECARGRKLLADDAAPTPVSVPAPAEDPDREQRLRALGYVE